MMALHTLVNQVCNQIRLVLPKWPLLSRVLLNRANVKPFQTRCHVQIETVENGPNTIFVRMVSCTELILH